MKNRLQHNPFGNIAIKMRNFWFLTSISLVFFDHVRWVIVLLESIIGFLMKKLKVSVAKGRPPVSFWSHRKGKDADKAKIFWLFFSLIWYIFEKKKQVNFHLWNNRRPPWWLVVVVAASVIRWSGCLAIWRYPSCLHRESTAIWGNLSHNSY